MARLLVNPGTSDAWEIQLKPGANRIGRGDHNDFKVPHGSVSGSHCEVILSDAGALLRDLGSTNGTFINRAPVREATLEPGQRLQLGSVEMVFDSDAPVATPTAAPLPVAPPIPPPAPVTARPGVLRIAAVAHAPAATPFPVAPPPVESESEPEPGPEALPPVAPINVGATFCKFHPKSLARFFCGTCRKYFCDMCVTTRATSAGQMKTCRACGVAVAPVRVHAGPDAGEKGFFARLPGAIVYPFKGSGLLILFCATIVFAVLDMMTGWFSILLTMAAIGYLFCFMQNIIHCTVTAENESLSMPEADGLFGAFFSLLGTFVMSYGLAVGLLVAKMFEVDIPPIAIVVAALFGCLYFPMALLAVALKDTALAANPMVVIPAILKMPLQYLVTAIVLMTVFGIRQLGQVMASVAGSVTFSTTDMSVLFMAMGFKAIWSFVSVYLLTVNMRILGLLYVTQKPKFGWF